MTIWRGHISHYLAGPPDRGWDDDHGDDDGDDDVDDDGEDDGEDDGDEKEEGESTTAQCNHKWQLGVPKLFLLWSP